MSNKSRSRKRKQELKDIVIFSKKINRFVIACLELKSYMQKLRELKYPKLATGGTVYGNSNELIKGREMVVPFRDHKIYLDDNDQYMFQND